MKPEPTTTMTDEQLKLSLSKMLPKLIEIYGNDQVRYAVWKKGKANVKDTEWLHVCWLIEQNLTPQEKSGYAVFLTPDRLFENYGCFASWQQRATALVGLTKHSVGVEI